MHKAAAAGNTLLVSCLARVGCSVANTSRDGCTPLALAVRRGDVECVKACACSADAKEAAFVIDSSSGR
jgi:ankyrin repeat protein